MAPRKTKSAGQAPAATQPPSTSASAPAALADREGGASTAASSNGVEDQVVAGAVSAVAGGDQTAQSLAEQPSPNSAPQVLDPVSTEQSTFSTDAEAAPIDQGDLIAIEGRSRDDRPYRRAGIVWTADWVEHLVTVAQSERLDADRHVLIRYL